MGPFPGIAVFLMAFITSGAAVSQDRRIGIDLRINRNNFQRKSERESLRQNIIAEQVPSGKEEVSKRSIATQTDIVIPGNASVELKIKYF